MNTFPELKNRDWQPTASIEALKARALLLEEIRLFFKKRKILEVETPLLCTSSATDPQINPIVVSNNFYLQTSPEFAMKRLLAAGLGPIYQLCKAFREDEIGRLHNPEFTILEWYRPGFDHHDLMDEVGVFLREVLNYSKVEYQSYKTVFEQSLHIDPHIASISQLKECIDKCGIKLNSNIYNNLNRDECLDLLMSHFIEPTLGFNGPILIYDYPASKAALAKIRFETPPVAERFEVYVEGIELANGYHELTDPKIQLKRFEEDNQLRHKMGLSPIPIDERLIAALKFGLPDAAGVALGVDRLLMLKLRKKSLKEVVAFTTDLV